MQYSVIHTWVTKKNTSRRARQPLWLTWKESVELSPRVEFHWVSNPAFLEAWNRVALVGWNDITWSRMRAKVRDEASNHVPSYCISDGQLRSDGGQEGHSMMSHVGDARHRSFDGDTPLTNIDEITTSPGWRSKMELEWEMTVKMEMSQFRAHHHHQPDIIFSGADPLLSITCIEECLHHRYHHDHNHDHRHHHRIEVD